ncbi:MAG: hypothetical protein JKY53_11325 [Flavobacteriales bacterium]|nr:hypothetical protein [Flavobacteriales bacterium]
MKIELNIFNSILFEGLRPWLSANRSEEKFKQKLSPSFKVPKGGFDEFMKVMNEALKDHPSIIEGKEYIFEMDDNKISIKEADEDLFEPLYDIDTPFYHNSKSEFYYYLIKNEETRFMSYLNRVVNSCESQKDGQHLINKVLDQLKYFLKECQLTIKKTGYVDNKPFDEIPTDETELEKKNSDYVMKVLRTVIIRIYLEIQELFPSYLKQDILTEDDLWTKIMGLPSPSMSVSSKLPSFYNRIIKIFIHDKPYEYDRAVKLINESKEKLVNFSAMGKSLSDIQSKKDLYLENIQVLENLIFLRELYKEETNPGYDELLDPKRTEQAFEAYTTEILEKAEEHSLANKKIEVIDKAAEKLKVTDTNVKVKDVEFKPSIPNKINHWLKAQKEFYTANMHIDFSKLQKLDFAKIEAKMTVPQLAYLFRAFDEIGLLNPKNKTDYGKLAEAAFKTTKTDGIKTKSFNNKYRELDDKVLEFWQEKFLHLLDEIRKNKEN